MLLGEKSIICKDDGTGCIAREAGMEGIIHYRVCLYLSLLVIAVLSLLIKPTAKLVDHSLDTGSLITEESANLSKTIQEYRYAYDD